MMHVTTRLMDELTAQDAFDIVAYQLLRQNERSTGSDGVKCLYRSRDGRRRCAIGWLMPDDVYSVGYEGSGVSNLAALLFDRRGDMPFARMLYRMLPLLRRLQETHDAFAPAEWAGRLRMIAQEFDLSDGVVEHCTTTFHHLRRPSVQYDRIEVRFGWEGSTFIGVDYGREKREAPGEVLTA
jgi:hypothetical protein